MPAPFFTPAQQRLLAALMANNGGRFEYADAAALTQAIADAGGGSLPTAQAAAVAARGSAGSIVGPLVPITIGNSISSYGFFDHLSTVKGFDEKSELAFALSLAPIAFHTKRTTPITSGTGLVDQYGNYGYAGQAIQTITTEMFSVLAPNLQTAGIKPTLICGTALLENDIYNQQLSLLPTLIGRVQTWIAAARLLAPNAIIHLCTPHPDGRIEQQTANLIPGTKALWIAVRDYMLTLDNGYDVFVTDLSAPGGTCNQANITQPLPGLTLADGAAVHPNGRGASLNGRLMAATFQRITSRVAFPNLLRSTNLGLIGTAAAGGVYAQGTNPNTGAAATPLVNFSQNMGAGATLPVVTAKNPGPFNIKAKATAAGGYFYVQMNNGAGFLPAGDSMAYLRVRINAGAASLRYLFLDSTQTGTPSKTTVSNTAAFAGTGALPVYQDGDVLHLYTPSITPTTSMTAFGVTLAVVADNTANTIDLDVEVVAFIDQQF